MRPGVTVPTSTVYSIEPGPVIVTRRTSLRNWLVWYYHSTHVSVSPDQVAVAVSEKAPDPPYSAGDWVTRLSDKAHSDTHLLLGDRQWAVLNPAGNSASTLTRGTVDLIDSSKSR